MPTLPRKPTTVSRTMLTALTVLACLLVVSACNSRGINGANGAIGSQGKGDWVCDAGKAADDWDCIQTEDIAPVLSELEARKSREAEQQAKVLEQALTPDQTRALSQTEPVLSAPTPDNPSAAITPFQAPPSPTDLSQTVPTQTVPSQTAPTQTVPSQTSLEGSPVPLPPGSFTTPQPIIDPAAHTRPKPIPEPPLATAPAPAPAPAPKLTTAEKPAAQVDSREEPAYAEFAYRPPEPVRIIDLPEEFYAAQLLAVSTKQQIEDFVIEKDLYNMSAARIEREGQILYVLLLGVYETEEIALKAVALMPKDVRELNPWVRPIVGLQESMTKAEQLMANAGPG